MPLIKDDLLPPTVKSPTATVLGPQRIPGQTVPLYRSREVAENDSAPEYNGSPWRLFYRDAKLFFKWMHHLPRIVIPLGNSVRYDELWPGDWVNVFNVALHLYLVVTQICFLVSLPFLIYLPALLFVGYIATFIIVNEAVCYLFLNWGVQGGIVKSSRFYSDRSWPDHSDEKWIFLNGVAVGYVWHELFGYQPG